jgi:hypothetical protein
MDQNDEEVKTIAIIELQSPLLAANDDQWQRVADKLAQRLQHPVVCMPWLESDERAQRYESLIAHYASQGFQRFVFLPAGLEPFDFSALRTAVAWLQRKPELALFVANDFCNAEWASVIVSSIRDFVSELSPDPCQAGASGKLALILASDGTSSLDCRPDELACMAHEVLQLDSGVEVHYAFLTSHRPSLAQVFDRLDRERISRIVLLPWRPSQEFPLRAVELMGELHQQDFSRQTIDNAWYWDRLSTAAPTPWNVLEHPGILHALLDKYLQALAKRSVERYFNLDQINSVNGIRRDWMNLDERVDAILPSEYQGRTDEVRSTSMGSATLKYDSQGLVAWDEIWTSFCDLAMAGGPPHRGKLLEAVNREQAMADLDAYQNVVREIRRGIEMVTGLQTLDSESLGWVGIVCDSEAMAVWLLRAIIVENVMVRREGHVIFVPAGPQFTIKRQVKNVITSVAKTVHYWRSHLKKA